jgi:hypothetical protein
VCKAIETGTRIRVEAPLKVEPWKESAVRKLNEKAFLKERSQGVTHDQQFAPPDRILRRETVAREWEAGQKLGGEMAQPHEDSNSMACDKWERGQ